MINRFPCVRALTNRQGARGQEDRAVRAAELAALEAARQEDSASAEDLIANTQRDVSSLQHQLSSTDSERTSFQQVLDCALMRLIAVPVSEASCLGAHFYPNRCSLQAAAHAKAELLEMRRKLTECEAGLSTSRQQLRQVQQEARSSSLGPAASCTVMMALNLQPHAGDEQVLHVCSTLIGGSDFGNSLRVGCSQLLLDPSQAGRLRRVEKDLRKALFEASAAAQAADHDREAAQQKASELARQGAATRQRFRTAVSRARRAENDILGREQAFTQLECRYICPFQPACVLHVGVHTVLTLHSVLQQPLSLMACVDTARN